MGYQDIVAAMNATGEFAARLGPAGWSDLGAPGALLAASMLFCVLAFFAAFTARRAKRDSSEILELVDDRLKEIRHLTAQAERASMRLDQQAIDTGRSQGVSERINSVRLGGMPDLQRKEMTDEGASSQPLEETTDSTASIEGETPTHENVQNDEAAPSLSEEEQSNSPFPIADSEQSAPRAIIRKFLRPRGSHKTPVDKQS